MWFTVDFLVSSETHKNKTLRKKDNLPKKEKKRKKDSFKPRNKIIKRLQELLNKEAGKSYVVFFGRPA